MANRGRYPVTAAHGQKGAISGHRAGKPIERNKKAGSSSLGKLINNNRSSTPVSRFNVKDGFVQLFCLRVTFIQ